MTSKLHEIDFEEEETHEFELVQTIPRKVFEDPGVSIDAAGLHPRAMLQIRDVTD